MPRKKRRDSEQQEEQQLEIPQEIKAPLTIEEAFARGLVGSKVKSREVFTSIIDKAAILANQFGGEETAEMLGIDLDFLEHALQGHNLTRQQTAILERGYNNLQIENDEINFDVVEQYAANLQEALSWINEEKYVGTKYKDTFRYALADGRVDVEENLNARNDIIGYTLFAQGLDGGHRTRINQFMADGGDTDEMFEAYRKDMMDKGSIFFERGDGKFDESFWWSWFRDTFYA